MKSSVNAPGKMIDHRWLAIPLAYMTKYRTKKNARLVIVEATKNTIAYSFRNDDSCKVGMVRRSLIRKHSNGKRFFLVEGKKVFLQDASMVI